MIQITKTTIYSLSGVSVEYQVYVNKNDVCTVSESQLLRLKQLIDGIVSKGTQGNESKD